MTSALVNLGYDIHLIQLGCMGPNLPLRTFRPLGATISKLDFQVNTNFTNLGQLQLPWTDLGFTPLPLGYPFTSRWTLILHHPSPVPA